jgi:pyruvate kinase
VNRFDSSWRIGIQNLLARLVITAIQMLVSMTEKNRSTRVEVSDVADAILNGADEVIRQNG